MRESKLKIASEKGVSEGIKGETLKIQDWLLVLIGIIGIIFLIRILKFRIIVLVNILEFTMARIKHFYFRENYFSDIKEYKGISMV